MKQNKKTTTIGPEKKKKKSRNTDKRPSLSIPVIVRSITLSGKASRKHFLKPLADFWSRRLVHGIVSTRVILSRATCACVCVYIYIFIYTPYITEKSKRFFLPSPESLVCMFPKAQEKENMEICNNNNNNNK